MLKREQGWALDVLSEDIWKTTQLSNGRDGYVCHAFLLGHN